MRNEAKVESGHEIKNFLCPKEQGPHGGFPQSLGKVLNPFEAHLPYSVDGTEQSLQQGCYDSVT